MVHMTSFAYVSGGLDEAISNQANAGVNLDETERDKLSQLLIPNEMRNITVVLRSVAGTTTTTNYVVHAVIGEPGSYPPPSTPPFTLLYPPEPHGLVAELLFKSL